MLGLVQTQARVFIRHGAGKPKIKRARQDVLGHLILHGTTATTADANDFHHGLGVYTCLGTQHQHFAANGHTRDRGKIVSNLDHLCLPRRVAT